MTGSLNECGDRIVVQTANDLAPTVAARWREQYGDEPKNPKFGEILRALDALGVGATAEEVEQIVGNESWTREWCAVCCRMVTTWARIGDEPDYESSTVYVCDECAPKVARALEAIRV